MVQSDEAKVADSGHADLSIFEVQERDVVSYGTSSSLCDQMCLLEYPNYFIIEPHDRNTYQSLLLDRSSGTAQLTWEIPYLGQVPLKSSTIHGVAGFINLLAGLYALVITRRELAGYHNGCQVFHVSEMKFLNCNSRLKFLSSQERRDEAHFVSLLRTVEKTPGLFFSYQTDLTLSLQRRNHIVGDMKMSPLWKQADPRFVWNHYMLEALIEYKMDPYVLPVIQGSFQVIQALLKEATLSLTIIARRCNRRLGTRMWRRGADFEGHVANFVETEQIVEMHGHICAYVQVRGSIPLLWEQIVDLTYKPRPHLLKMNEMQRVVEHHFHDLVERYGSVLAINLVDQQGSEELLSIAYTDAMENLIDKQIRYISFDFNKICGHVHFERLSILYEKIGEELQQQGYFRVKSNGEIQEQKGVVRVNCVDCLDRTNITQSLFASKALNTILQEMDIFENQESIEQHEDFYQRFKILWPTHGDDISIQYSGTHALKGDYVRHGKRTCLGFLKDGVNALIRYYLNNFHDGTRQDAVDLICGHYVVSRLKPSPFQLNGFEAFAYLPFASALIVTGLTFTTTSICKAGQDIYYFVSSILWAGFTAGVAALVKANGRLFCSRPRLCKLL